MTRQELINELLKVDGNLQIAVQTENEFYTDISVKVKIKVDGNRIVLIGDCE